MRYDLRAALRHLAKSPLATALSVLSIALGIGLTTGIFSVADAMLLRPIPIDRPGELFELASRADDGHILGYGWPDYLDMVEAGKDVLSLAAYQRRGSMLAGPEQSQLVLTNPVTPNFFSVLGVRAQLGNTTLQDTGGRPSVILGFRLWQGHFGGDPQIVGKTIVLNNKPFFIAGVMPPQFAGLQRGVNIDIWMNMDAWFHTFGQTDEMSSRGGQFEMVARLKPGVSVARATAVLDTAIRGAGKHKPAAPGVQGTFLSASFAHSWSANLIFGGGLLLVLGGVLFVACANVAQLRLAQSESRKKEMGLRMALGAHSWRITRQLLVETAFVSVAGASLGILLARFLIEKVTEFVAAATNMDFGVRLDARVLSYALLALLASIVFAGLAPARLALRLNVWEVIAAEQGVAGRRGGWQKRGLVAGQVAVSVALFGCATLFLVSFRNAATVHPGLDPQKKLLALSVAPGPHDASAASWCEPACARLAGLPGVRSATYARRLPLADSGGGFLVRVEVPGMAPMSLRENNVGGNYFPVMGTRVIAGRGIDSNDREGTLPVVVISRNFAKTLLAGREPLGQWVKVDGVTRQVVGIAEDGPSNELHEPPSPYIFLPYTQVALGDITLMVETAGDPAALERAVRQELKRYDSRMMIFETGTLRRQLDSALAGDTIMASISSGLGVFGVLLTAAGLFGVMQYSVARRSREFGVRMAMGARPVEIQRLILAESLRISAWGIPIGLVLLAVAAWYARSLVLGVSALDLRIYAASAVAALALTIVAAWLPARRATHVDPMAALRSE